MQKDKVEEKEQFNEEVGQEETVENQEQSQTNDSELNGEKGQEENAEQSAAERLQIELTESKDKYLRLYSEFENFRRRTSKEKLELINSATKGLMEALVPVLDDFERAIKSLDDSDDAAKEGTLLIYNKFKNILESKGLKIMEVKKGDEFNDDFHEAITQIPADEELAGKVVDVVENGYFLGEKVIRFAKVVTGAKA